MTDLFLAQTPVNLLISAALAIAETTTAEPHLIACSRTDGEEAWTRAASTSQHWPFSTTTFLDRRLKGLSPWSKWRRIRTNIQLTRHQVRQLTPDRIWFFNDQFPSVQAACVEAKRVRPDARRIFIDEGLSSYGIRPFPVPGAIPTAIRRLALGHWWEELPLNGTSSHADEARLLYPEFANPAIRPPRQPLGRELFDQPQIKRLLADLVPPVDKELTTLVFTGRSSLTPDRERLRQQYVDIIAPLAAAGETIGLKAHPAEESDDPFDLGKTLPVICLPRHTPSEVFVMHFRQTLRCVVGDGSSALMTARWLLPDADIVSCSTTANEALSAADRQLLDLLRNIDIRVGTPADAVQETPLPDD